MESQLRNNNQQEKTQENEQKYDENSLWLEGKQQRLAAQTAANNRWFKKLSAAEQRVVTKMVEERRMPFCKRSTNMRKMTSRRGTEFEIYGDTNSFYSGNDRQPHEPYLHVYSLTDSDKRNDVTFTYGEMEGARKLLWRDISRHYNQCRTKSGKATFLVGTCYSVLRAIQQEMNGQAEEFRQVFSETQFAQEAEELEAVYEEAVAFTTPAPAEEFTADWLPEPRPTAYLIKHEHLIPYFARVTDAPKAQGACIEEPMETATAPEEDIYEYDEDSEEEEEAQYQPHHDEGDTVQRYAHAAPEQEDQDIVVFQRGWRLFREGEEVEVRTRAQLGMAPVVAYGIVRRKYGFHHQTAQNQFEAWSRERQRNYWVQQCQEARLNGQQPPPEPGSEPLPLAQADVQNEVTKEENTTFTDQRSTVVDDGYISSQIEPNMRGVSMQESQWHVREVMSKPIPFFHGDWGTSDAQGKILKQWDLPGDTLLGPHYNQVATFVFWRGHPTIRFQINGTKFHNGRLIAAFIPAFQFTQYDEKLYDVDVLTSLPHVILDAGFSNSGIINLPFVHMNTYFNTVQGDRGWQSLGRLVLVVFNRLGSATTSSQSIGVTAWVHYDNCELHQPCYAHTVNLPKVNSRGSRDAPPRAQAAVEGIVKSALPMITDLVAPGLGGLVGNVMGGTADCDKPTDPAEISRWVPNAVTSLSLGTGLDKSSRLSLNTSTYTLGDADLISTTTDDMNMLEVMKIPTRLATLKWKSTNNTGDNIFKLPVCPNLFTNMSQNSKVKPPVDIISPTLFSYCVKPFKFWRGGIRYKIQIVASQMHSGRMMIAFGPGLTDMKFDGATYINTYVIDLQERHEVEFVIPYMAERPWMRCDRFRQFDSSSLAEGDHENFENIGYLYMYVLNRLSRPDSVSAEIDVNILISAADDFEVAVPADLACVQGIGDVIDITPGAKAQAMVGQTDVSERTEEGIVVVSKGGGKLSETAASTLSENAMNLKTLLRRYYKVYSNKFTLPSETSSISFANSPTLSGVNKCFNSKNGVQMRTHIAHFSELFTFWRGSLRYKLVWSIHDDTNFPSVTARVFHIPGAFIFGNFTPATMNNNQTAILNACDSYGTLLGQSNIQSSLEFEVPFYTPYTQLRTIQGATSNARSSTGVVIVVFDKPPGGGNPQIHLDLYQAAGDDFGLNYLRAAPKIQVVRASEEQRMLGDNATFLYKTIPDICPTSSTEEHIANAFQQKCMAQGLVSEAPARRSIEVEAEPEPAPREVEEEDVEEQQPVAQGWADHVPILGDHIRATRSMASAGESLSTVCDTANHIMQQAATRVGLGDDEEKEDDPTLIQSLTKTASGMSDPIISIFTTLSEYIKNLPSAIGVENQFDLYATIIDVAALITAFNSFQNGSIVVKTLAIMSICSILFGAITTITKNALYTFVCRVVSNLYGCKKGNEQPVAQASILDFVAPLTATLSIAVGMLGFKNIPSDKETTDIVKGISEKLRLFNFSSLAISNVRALWVTLKDLFDWVIEKIVGLFNPMFLAQLKLQREFEDVETWAAFIDELEGSDYEDRIHWDPEFKRKVYRAVDKGKRYNAYLTQGKIGREANVVREYVRKALEICTRCDKSKNMLPFRKDPYCITMFGKTGVGKSGIITELAYTLMDELEYPKHNRWCAINCNDKFFNENYAQQTAVYFDDFSTFTTEEQYQAFFNLKANTAYPLNMAFKKGEYFNSDFIFMTTNTSHPAPNCLTCIPALWRRRDALIEADFIDELQKDGMAGEFVMREDNSHARYRFIDPRDARAAPLSEWMDYRSLVAELMVRAQIHQDRQERKLNRDLARAGYIIPTAQAGRERRLCLEALRNCPSLSLYSPDIWEHLVYNVEREEFELPATAPVQVRDDYTTMKMTLTALGLPADFLKERLRMNSTEIRDQRSLITKITGKLCDLKNVMKGLFSKIMDCIPSIGTIARCAFRLAIALFALQTIDNFVVGTLHACGCMAMRYFGFRCGMCGKWPKLENSPRKEWVLEEWASLYDTTPYKDGHITTIEEEATIRQIQTGEKNVRGVTAGTKKKAEGGPYSDNTNGAKIVRVVANNAPYQQETKGQATPRVVAHAQDKHVTDLINNRVLSCLYRVRFQGSSEFPAISMQAFAIGARMIVSMGHFFDCMREGEYFDIYHSNQWMPVEFNSSKLHKLEGKDLCVYEMPLQFHLHKSNLTHFVSEKELAYARKFPATLVKINSQLQNVLMECGVEPVEEIKYDFEVGGKMIPIKVQKAWKYRLLTQAGDCGAPLLAHCTKLQGRILGFHVCGNTIHGWATLITREMLEKFITTHDGSCIPQAQAKLGNLIPQGHFGRIGKSDKIFFQSDATQIIKTDIHGEISAPVTFPAVLSKNDDRLTKRVNPITNGIAKYSKALRPFPLRHREMVNDYLKSELDTYTRLRRPALLTEDETVKGITEFEQAFEPLPLNTSPGWPYVNTRPRGESGKAYLFDINGSMKDEELIRRYKEREQRAMKGERVESVWIDCMKDERRPLEKIQSGSTRLFTIGPVDLTLLSRKYCQDFVEAIKASRGYSHCKLGIDPQSLEWTELYNYLRSFSDCMVAGDFTRFDGTVHGELIEDYFEDIDYFYKTYGEHKPEDTKVRRVLADEICNTVQLAKDEFYMTHGGNPSGNQQTTPLNSRTNYRYMALAWLGIVEQQKLWKYFSMAAFSNNVRIACYGDDNILAIKRDVVEWFNQETISEHLEQYGIVYTNETKDGITKWKKLDECTFLKQGFRDHESISGIKAPIMKESTLLELLNWTRIAPDQDELLIDNCHDCLRFAYFYGKEFFNSLRTKIQHALNKHEKNFRLMTYMDYHFWFLGTIGMVESKAFKTRGT